MHWSWTVHWQLYNPPIMQAIITLQPLHRQQIRCAHLQSAWVGNACCTHAPYPCIKLKAPGPGPLRDSCILALHPTLDRIMFTEVRNNTNRTRTMYHRKMDGQISLGCRNVPLLCSIRYAIPTSQRLVSRSIILRDHCSRTRRCNPVYGCLYILQMFLCRSR